MEEERPKVKERLRVCMVREIEKLKGRKWWEDKKDFYFFYFYLVGSGKVERWKNRGMKKVSLNKFTHILLIKNDAQKVTRKKKEIIKIY